MTDMALSEDLKRLLANTIALHLRAYGYHWNVEGQDFREYHGLFEEIVDDLYASIDPIAENIRKLGEYAPYRLERIEDMVDLPEKSVDTSAKAMAEDLCDGITAYIKALNSCFDTATSERQQGVANFLADRIDMCQKWCWFLRSSTKV